MRFLLSLAIVLLGPVASANAATAAAGAFLATLSAEERQEAQLPLDSPARGESRLTPGRRAGLYLNEMDAQTRVAAQALLGQLLTEKGVAIVRTVHEREARLGEIENNPSHRDPELYAVAIFGDPAVAARWAFRYEGHHLSINLTLEGDRIVSVLPLLIGANPEKGPPGDLLLPFISAAQDEVAFASELASLFPAGSRVESDTQYKLKLQNLDSLFGHPHLTVNAR